jgi:CMP-N-acetylneuraminic acid synthetase
LKKFKNLAIIPARGGSKRLPGKNMVDLGGKPLIVHSIEYALENKDIIDRIVVSTDSEEIKNIAIKSGVDVIIRPEELSDDYSPTWEAVKHAITETGEIWDHVFVLQPTNPLRPKNLLRKAYDKFLNSSKKCLFTISRSERKLGKITNNTYRTINYKFGERSQDMVPLYYENGLLYIVKPEFVMEENCLISEENIVYEVSHPYSGVDIDTAEDLDYARFLLNSAK